MEERNDGGRERDFPCWKMLKKGNLTSRKIKIFCEEEKKREEAREKMIA